MKIHKEGYRLIVVTFLLTLLTGLAIYLWVPFPGIIKNILYLGLLLFFVFILRFFRLPSRHLRHDENSILAPADGKVVVIEEVENAEYFGDRRVQVSIFMSPHDVHVNWFPVSGLVKYVKYFPGKYLVAWHPKSSLENERTSVVIESLNGESILVRQIAGAVARRVVCYPSEGDHFKQGDQLGFIKFGSRVDLLLPPNSQIHVALNQRTRGLESVIASFGETTSV